MLPKTGLLIISNPNQIGKVLSNIQAKVKTKLYIQLLSALNGPLSFHPNLFTNLPMYSKLIWGIYSQAATYCEGLDVCVLLSTLKCKSLPKIQTNNTIELVIFDTKYNDTEIDGFMKAKIENISKECGFLTFSNGQSNEFMEPTTLNNKVYKHTVLGGTFDRLHIAHKILLSEAALRSSSKVTVGITEENMLVGKTLWELTEPLQTRMDCVKKFLMDTCTQLEINVVPINDPYGPTQHDPDMELLVVSAETAKGGQKVNEVRKSKGLPALDILEVELIGEPNRNSVEEGKISSSTARMRLLGTMLKPAKSNSLMCKKPFVIGLTGGIASGKSGISERLQELGAEVIDCDKVAHEVYRSGKPCHTSIVEAFGEQILDENGEINRKVLGSIVFKSPDQLLKLNDVVWPAIAEEVNNRIQKSHSKVVVVEAAVLLKAGWEKFCHEVWTSIIPEKEAIQRLIDRNGLNEGQARERIASQHDNQTYVNAANVVFCSAWTKAYTHDQVDKAWTLLQNRLL